MRQSAWGSGKSALPAACSSNESAACQPAEVDAAGVIRWIDVAPNHARPAEAAEIISALGTALS